MEHQAEFRAQSPENGWHACVREAAAQCDGPFYLYRGDLLEDRIAALRAAFGPAFALQYAVKTNPNPHLLSHLKGRVDRLDISSGGELRLALAAGWPARKLRFCGPAKSTAELEAAVAARIGGIVAEHPDELREIDSIAARSGCTMPVLLRISPSHPEPGFSVRLGGKPGPFGIDEEALPDTLETLRGCARLRLAGFHIYSASQSLSDAALAGHFGHLAESFTAAVDLWGAPVDELVFGAGLGIPYHPGDGAVSLDALRPAVEDIRGELASRLPGTGLVLELGRYVMGEAGVYVTRVRRTKSSRGTDIAICDGGMHHNMAACGLLGGLAHKPYRMSVIRPDDRPAGPVSTWRIAGPLCTTVDTLAHRAELPALRPGDILILYSSGGYGPSASPVHFISHDPPRELFLDGAPAQATYRDITWITGFADGGSP